MKKTIRISSRVTLEIDHNDPYTPAMVTWGGLSSSFDYAYASGTIEDQYALTDAEMATLGKHEDAVNEAFEIARKDHPEYN
jgi:hypothetical protein